MTICQSQSECFNSVMHSYTTIKFVFGIKSCTVNPLSHSSLTCELGKKFIGMG